MDIFSNNKMYKYPDNIKKYQGSIFYKEKYAYIKFYINGKQEILSRVDNYLEKNIINIKKKIAIKLNKVKNKYLYTDENLLVDLGNNDWLITDKNDYKLVNKYIWTLSKTKNKKYVKTSINGSTVYFHNLKTK